jgi:hypothetical protein
MYLEKRIDEEHEYLSHLFSSQSPIATSDYNKNMNTRTSSSIPPSPAVSEEGYNTPGGSVATSVSTFVNRVFQIFFSLIACDLLFCLGWSCKPLFPSQGKSS